MIDAALSKLHAREDLSVEETQDVFNAIFDGKLDAQQIGDLLLALRDKGEALSEIQGAVRSMRSHMLSINAPDGTIDIVGTGGDGHSTYNVSSGAAFVVAGAGVPVAKHGNRAASSVSGSSDVLRALGLNLEPTIDHLEQALNEIGVAFLFAPRHHPAMRHVADVRRKLGTRTIFNLLGPMTNPANVKHHIIGVFDNKWSLPMAEVLQSLGSQAAWITHGADGLDEISTTGPSHVVELNGNAIRSFEVEPQQVGIECATLDDLRGGDADLNAIALRAMLDGKKGAFRDIVVMNAAGALVVAGKATTLAEGVEMAQTSIDSGAARHKLDELIALTENDG